MLSRGVLRGQRRSWMVAVALLAATLVLHLVHAADVITLLVCAAVLVLLIVQRERFRAQTEQGTSCSAFLILAVGGIDGHPGRLHRRGGGGPGAPPRAPAWPHVLLGSAERLVGIAVGRLPAPHRPLRLGRACWPWASRLIVVALYLLTRPVVDRRLSPAGPRSDAGPPSSGPGTSSAATAPAPSTTSPCATTSSGSSTATPWWPTPCSAGVCLVSPDPIGPFSERAHVWDCLPPLRRPQRLGAGRHGRRRGVAPDLPGLGDALPLHRRRSGGRPAPVLARGRQDEGVAPGGQPGGPLRLHRALLGPGPPATRRRRPHGRADGQEPTGRAGARLLHDAGPAVRPAATPGCSSPWSRGPTARRWPCASSCPRRPSAATRSTSCAATRASTPTGCSTSPCARPSPTSRRWG